MNNRNNTSFNEVLDKINNLDLNDISFFSDHKDISSFDRLNDSEKKMKQDIDSIADKCSEKLSSYYSEDNNEELIGNVAKHLNIEVDDPNKIYETYDIMIQKLNLIAVCIVRMDKEKNIELANHLQLLINAIHHKRKQFEESQIDKNLLAIESFCEKGIKKLVEQITCMISALPEIYQQLKKTGYHQDTHLDDVNSLAEASIKMVITYRNRNTRNVEKFRQLIKLLQDQLDTKTTTLSLHSLFGRSLVDKLNASPNEHHYTRLIAYVLNSIVQDMESTLTALNVEIKKHSALQLINMPDQYHELFKRELPLAYKKLFNPEFNGKTNDGLVLPTCLISLEKESNIDHGK